MDDVCLLAGAEGGQPFIAVWMKLSDFKDNPRVMLVPEGLFEMLANEACMNEIKHVNTKRL